MEITETLPDYLFYAGDKVAYGPGSKVLYDLAQRDCPYLFETVAAPPNMFGYITYRLKKDLQLLAQCQYSISNP